MLGPVLFSIYIRSIPKLLDPLVDSSTQFADDVSFDTCGESVSVISDTLSRALQNLLPWLASRGLSVNISKTQAMLIQPKGTPSCQLAVSTGTFLLTQVPMKKFLGLIIDDRLSWTHQVDAMLSKTYKKIGALRRTARALDTQSKRTYYLSIIQSDLMYGAAAYHHLTSALEKHRIELACKAGVRAIFNLPPWESASALFKKL